MGEKRMKQELFTVAIHKPVLNGKHMCCLPFYYILDKVLLDFMLEGVNIAHCFYFRRISCFGP